MTLEKRLREDAGLLPRLAVAAVFPMLLTPLLQFVRNAIWPERSFGMFGQEITYPGTVSLANAWGTAGFVLLWLIVIVRAVAAGKPSREMLRKVLPQGLFLLLAIWAVAVCLLTGQTQYMTEGAPVLEEPTLMFVLYFAGYFFAGMLLSRERSRRIIVVTIMAVGAVLGTLSLVHTYVVSLEPAYNVKGGLSAVFYNANHYAYFMTLCILLSAVCFAMEKTIWLRLAALYSFLCNVVVLNINNTLGCFLAALFALGGFLWLAASGRTSEDDGERRRHTRAALMLLVVYVVVMLFMSLFYNTILRSLLFLFFDIRKIVSDTADAEHAGSSRWKLWQCTLQYIAERPLTGHGTDGTAVRLAAEANYSRPHDEYLQYAVFWGIPAALLYISACGVTLLRALGRVRRSTYGCAATVASAGYLASACFGNTKYYTSPYFFLLLGITASVFVWRDDGPEPGMRKPDNGESENAAEAAPRAEEDPQ